VKAIETHGKRHPELPELKLAFWRLLRSIVAHMLHEEKVLFPQLIQLESEPGSVGQTVASRIDRMIAEHDDAGDYLADIRRLASDFVPPPDACMNYRALCQALAAWEKDLLQHLHMENNILFRKAMALQTRVDRLRWRGDHGAGSDAGSSSSTGRG
jgi:regulator of cell morphogenesis and NO signaling